jgi:hypothetical protein
MGIIYSKCHNGVIRETGFADGGTVTLWELPAASGPEAEELTTELRDSPAKRAYASTHVTSRQCRLGRRDP